MNAEVPPDVQIQAVTHTSQLTANAGILMPDLPEQDCNLWFRKIELLKGDTLFHFRITPPERLEVEIRILIAANDIHDTTATQSLELP